ncbi:caldesmon 1a isoform X1 [Nerophis lumbriciformis]|uniref:caldesmon 1a isoform X1 n=3 Tax=Nerophis lumbriciformis TaxID=546530 RepID=UPI002ADF9A53|nr:non-muscle caldesmon-like isoform X1 [Nerophis lumbriciformis]
MSRYEPQGATMEEMDFDRRRELRRQKREEMRLEAERMSRNDDDEEEAARERRRRARQERLRSRELEESSGQPDSLVLTNSHSVTESDSVSSSYGGNNDDNEEQALLERMAKREERRQRRLKEALERQTQLDAETEGQRDYDVGGGGAAEKSKKQEVVEDGRSSSWSRYHHGEEEEKEVVVVTREEEEAAPDEERVMDEKPRRSYLREEELTGKGSHSLVSSNQAESADVVAEEAPEGDYVDATSGSERTVQGNDSEADREVCQILQSQDNQLNEASRSLEVREEQRKQNGGLHEEEEEEEEDEAAIPKQHRNLERTLSRGSVRSPEASAADEQDEDDTAARLEAERKLEELKRRRDDAENEEFERRRQKQQEAEAELEELKRKREERRKVLEEEERQKKQEETDKKAKEEEEKRKMKEEIERRRAEAAEKRQKVEDPLDSEDKLFKCVSPRGSSLKIGERAEFLNKSAQKSTVKTSLTPVVSKIDNRLEQYTSAVLRENKESRSPRSGAVDLPVVADSIRNIKSMWEKGSVFSTSGSGGSSAFKEAAAIKSGVAGRINDWLNKTPESSKASAGRPSDLKPVDVSNKRSLWENKGSSTAKAAGTSDTKSVTNGMGH